MAHDEELKLLDSIFELLKGSRDQKCQRVLFGLYEYWDEVEKCTVIRERKPGQSASVWFNQLCCAELRNCYSREKAEYTNNHAFTGLVNHQQNKTNETLYRKYLKPTLCEYGREMTAHEQKHLLQLLELGVGLSSYWNDSDFKSKGIPGYSADLELRTVKEEIQERCQRAVFGEGGIRERFLEPTIVRKGRVTGGHNSEEKPPEDTGHRKKTQMLPGPYAVLTKLSKKNQYKWFVEQVSRGYLDRCTDREIFFGVLAAAFVLGLNLDDDKDICKKVREYVNDLIGDSESIREFKLLLAGFSEEKNAAELRGYSLRLRCALQKSMKGTWNAHDLNHLIQSRKKHTENEMDKIRNLYLEWLEARIECELLQKELAEENFDGFLRKSDLDACVQNMNSLKDAADRRLDRLLAMKAYGADAVHKITAQTAGDIEF